MAFFSSIFFYAIPDVPYGGFDDGDFTRYLQVSCQVSGVMFVFTCQKDSVLVGETLTF